MTVENKEEVRKAAAVLRLLGKVLLCSFLFALLMLTLWFAALVYQGDRVYEIHTAWFAMSRAEFDLIHYCGMGFLKLSAVVFFLAPALAIWLVARPK